MATVTEKVTEVAETTADKLKESSIVQGAKEKLVGVELEPSAQIQASFSQHALKDEESGEFYMGQTEFVNAVAPTDEDYVSTFLSFFV
jgi:solute carrier family 25 aspartate/glutamate transporter 12/13